MCLVFLVFGCDPPRPRLLIAFNRDEFFKRSTQPLHFWDSENGVLAGRDLEGGGTWLGVNVRTGRLAFLTNLRSRDVIVPAGSHNSSLSSYASRGELVTAFLTGGSSPLDYVQSIACEQYHGFNLVVGELVSAEPRVGDLAYTNNAIDSAASTGIQNSGGCTYKLTDGDTRGRSSNGGGSADAPSTASTAVELLVPGRVYGLSNGQLMEWPKVLSGVRVFENILNCMSDGGEEVPYDRIFGELLGDSERLVPRGKVETEAAAAIAAAPAETGNGGRQSDVQAAKNSFGDKEGGDDAGGEALVETFDVSNFQEQLSYITSGRFVKAVSTPYGLYGTRSQTVIVIGHDGTGEARERHHCDDGTWAEVVIPFQFGGAQ